MKTPPRTTGPMRRRGRIALLRNVRFRRAGAHRDRRLDNTRQRTDEEQEDAEWDDEPGG